MVRRSRRGNDHRPSFVTTLDRGEIRSFEILPEDAGIARASLTELAGGDPAANAAALQGVLGGEKNAIATLRPERCYRPHRRRKGGAL